MNTRQRATLLTQEENAVREASKISLAPGHSRGARRNRSLLLSPARFVARHTRDLGGPYVTLEFDEVAYSAYLNSLIEGGPRRSDPFERPDAKSTQAETLFSIQFLPPYVLAVPARILGLGASTMFILLGPIAAFLTALALFWLIASVTSDDRLAAVGVLLIMCLASFAGTPLALRMLLKMHNPFPYLPFLPFLRRYVPAVPFPFYLAFCVFFGGC